MYTSKRGQKSKRAKWKDRAERRYFVAHAECWERAITLMTPTRVKDANRGLTPRTGALLIEWAELRDVAGALLNTLDP